MKTFKLLIFFSFIVYSSQDDRDSLELVIALFRHGARTPERKDVYPRDPYTEAEFMPMGYGQLTSDGMRMAYKLGQLLRKRYSDLIPESYLPTTIYARSTDYDRTKATAALVLAGLFPPRGIQIWNENLPWLPIPVAYEKYQRDYVLTRPNKHCPKYANELEQILNSRKVLNELSEKQDFLYHLSKHTGKNMSTYADVFGLYQTLTAEKTMNLKLPKWLEGKHMDTITRMAIRQCELETFTPNLKKLFGGRILQKVIRTIDLKITNTMDPERKMLLYSGHEYFIFAPLAALGLYDTHFPKYASSLIFELHEPRTREFYIKMLYQRDLDKEPEVLKLKDCPVMCPYQFFLNQTVDVMPLDYTEECESKIFLN